MKLTSSTSKISLASEVEESSGIDDGLSDLIETAKSLVLKGKVSKNSNLINFLF